MMDEEEGATQPTPASPELADLLASDIGGLEDALPRDNDLRPSLASLDGVDFALRQFIASVIAFRGDYLKAPEKGADVATFLTREAAQMRDAFYGRTQAFKTAAWNSPDQLGTTLEDRARISGDPEAALEAYFIGMGSDVLQLCIKHEDGNLDDGGFRFNLNVIVEEATALLLGLPKPVAD